ncbi:MAG: SRPBCC family protein [Acidimicrobiia bacterium]|nr:SRPBCC family protein [Acidimicrobiia bacterium]
MSVEVDRRWSFVLDAPPDAVWATLVDTASYTTWWPWLRGEDLPEVTIGAEASVTISPPLPYELDVHIAVTDIDPPRRVATAVSGDLAGTASVELAGTDVGTTTVTLDFSLVADGSGVGRIPQVAAPLLRLGHEVVMERGVRQFARATGLRAVQRGPSATAMAVDVVTAAVVAGVVSGGPSTLWAVATGRPVLEATRAAGTLLGRPGVLRGLVAHSAISLGWASVVTAAVGRGRRTPTHPEAVALGVAIGAGVAMVDLGLVARRRYPQIAALPVAPQVADHLVFGGVAGAVVAHRRRD